jgi:hypothetical protein
MTHDRHEQLRRRAGDLNTAVSSLLNALQRDIAVIESHLRDAKAADAPEAIQQLREQRDRCSRDLDVLRDQVPILKRLTSSGARQGRETAALSYVNKLAQAFLLAVDDIDARARLILSPAMLERTPAWEVESARASVADTEGAAILLKRVLEGAS